MKEIKKILKWPRPASPLKLVFQKNQNNSFRLTSSGGFILGIYQETKLHVIICLIFINKTFNSFGTCYNNN